VKISKRPTKDISNPYHPIKVEGVVVYLLRLNEKQNGNT
jgi:hypothetical protein